MEDYSKLLKKGEELTKQELLALEAMKMLIITKYNYEYIGKKAARIASDVLKEIQK